MLETSGELFIIVRILETGKTVWLSSDDVVSSIFIGKNVDTTKKNEELKLTLTDLILNANGLKIYVFGKRSQN